MSTQDSKENIKQQPAGGDDERLTIKDQTDLSFKLKKSTPFKKLFQSFCEQKNMDRNAVRFVFDGQPIGETTTPQQIGLEDGDTIDALIMQVGGSF